MHTHTQEAAEWWARPRGQENVNWITNYQRSLKNRHRNVIVETVLSLGDVRSVLEVGSHCGPNLIRLAQDCPRIEQLSGFDVNADAITAGRRWVKSLGLDERIELSEGRIPEKTQILPDGCVDVVLSCYALAYIAPEDLDAVLYEMGRLAQRAVVIAEPMSASGSEPRRTMGGYTEWAHNYQAASRWIGTLHGCETSTRTVDPPVDRLERVFVAARGSMPSAASMP